VIVEIAAERVLDADELQDGISRAFDPFLTPPPR
jgi:hypothetical protein